MRTHKLCFLALMAVIFAASGVQAESIGLLEKDGGMATLRGSAAEMIAAFDASQDTSTIRAGVASQQFLLSTSEGIHDATASIHPSWTQGIESPFHPPFHPEVEITQVPEPATLLLLATGLMGGAVRKWQLNRNS